VWTPRVKIWGSQVEGDGSTLEEAGRVLAMGESRRVEAEAPQRLWLTARQRVRM
jgi:hypothetical protein